MTDVLDRRLQVLVSEQTFARLQAESKRSGRSIGSIVRCAIDLQWSSEADDRRLAGLCFLAATESPRPTPEPDWALSKRALDEENFEKLEARSA